MFCEDPENCHDEMPTCAVCVSAKALHAKVSPMPWHKTTAVYRETMRLKAYELMVLGPEPPEVPE